MARRILLVEDDHADALLFNHALRLTGIETEMHRVADGFEATEYLSSRRLPDSPLPDIVFLDLKLPKMDGFEVLRWIRIHFPHLLLRTIILSGSEEPRDREAAHQLGAAHYCVKPTPPAELRDLLQAAVAR